MKKQYLFIFLIIVMLYLLSQIGLYKYDEYRVLKYMEEISATNEEYEQQIQIAQHKIEKITTKAYINKALKSQQWLKFPSENVITLITEERYNTYTQTWSENQEIAQNITLDPLTDESLLATMTNYQKWVYLIFWKDIR